jgi:hypothetical protein
MTTTVIKNFVIKAGLDPVQFAFHSLKKGSITQLNTNGIEREEANTRENYARESVMV